MSEQPIHIGYCLSLSGALASNGKTRPSCPPDLAERRQSKGRVSLDDAKLAQFTRDVSFKTVVGDVKFGKGGGWSEARVLQVQYQNIKGADLSEFKDASTQAVVWPLSIASGTLIYPYAKAKRNG